MSHQRRRSRVSAISLRVLWQRFAFLILALLAAWLIILGEIRPQVLAPARIHITDAAAPLLDAMARPADMLRDMTAVWRDWMDLHDEVVQLRAENARLKQWELAGTALGDENRALKQLLKFHGEPATGSLSARVIATSGGPFAAGMIITAGARDGVRPGMAAMTPDGLIGRVTEVGDWSSRILLLTDKDSRLPVMLQESGERGILAGDNEPDMRLLYLPENATVAPGARLVTSGHGGLLPPNLPVAVVTEHDRTATHAIAAADIGRVHYVQLVDFSLAGGSANPFVEVLHNAKP